MEEELESDVLPVEADDTVPVELPSLESIVGRVQESGQFSDRLISFLHSGLWSNSRRPLSVFTGLSGSGKTLLALSYARALNESGDKIRHLVTAVQPGWYDPAPLFGYVNPLRGDSYVRTEFVDFIIAASEEPAKPYCVVLDEMNLSHPEQYLAPILSAMETGEPIVFHGEGKIFDGIPKRIPYPSNLAIIGTVNMDETTHGLSDKVLDRAFTLEFWDVDVDRYPRWKREAITAEQTARVRALLAALNKSLSPARLHFGWRTIGDVLDFLEHAAQSDWLVPFEAALDGVICAKVLPKLRGSDSERLRSAFSAASSALEEHGLPEAGRKISDLLKDLSETGSARFWR